MATKSSELRKRFGITKEAIKATRAFVKPIEHFQEKGIDGKAWILMNDNDGTRISVNTYNGTAGKNFNAQIHPIPADEKGVAQLVKGYTEVAVGECPVAEAVKSSKKTAKV